ncbi:hypothetical protein B0T24DRAFT_677289 [Lasiosphaeria ovina]|uniref:Uncharacterized protein n=1 Tax=Lasiosphaeria ovina TaxID=92902 RepID=A0AAE0KGI8_9PEZI|nr:hypothetical protein B0T24DRAFT_677289 [Lasiosphaeria ovina]
MCRYLRVLNRCHEPSTEVNYFPTHNYVLRLIRYEPLEKCDRHPLCGPPQPTKHFLRYPTRCLTCMDQWFHALRQTSHQMIREALQLQGHQWPHPYDVWQKQKKEEITVEVQRLFDDNFSRAFQLMQNESRANELRWVDEFLRRIIAHPNSVEFWDLVPMGPREYPWYAFEEGLATRAVQVSIDTGLARTQMLPLENNFGAADEMAALLLKISMIQEAWERELGERLQRAQAEKDVLARQNLFV